MPTAKSRAPNPTQKIVTERARLRDAARVPAAMKDLRKTYQRGQKALKEATNGHAVYGQMKEVDDSGGSSQLLRNARLIAKHYTPPKFEQLIKECKKNGFPLGSSLLTRLVTIPKGPERHALQKRLIKEHWSRRQLDVEIAKLMGNQESKAGRKIKAPADQVEALHGLRRQGRTLRKLCTVITSKSGPKVPMPVLGDVRAVERAISQLLDSIDPILLDQP
jgi:hypothetical protein